MKSMLIAVGMAASAGAAFGGTTTAFLEDFEGAAQWTSSTAEFSDGVGDFWGNSANITWGSFVNYSGADGAFFAGMDLDGEGESLPIVQTFDTFSIAGLSDLTVSVDLAEDQDGSDEDYDDVDYVLFEYRVDGGAWETLFEVLDIENGNEFNEEPGVNGDAGMPITDTFGTFSFDLAGVSGNDMALRITWQLDAGDEDLAIDNLSVSGIPAPGAAALFGLAGLTASRRRRG